MDRVNRLLRYAFKLLLHLATNAKLDQIPPRAREDFYTTLLFLTNLLDRPWLTRPLLIVVQSVVPKEHRQFFQVGTGDELHLAKPGGIYFPAAMSTGPDTPNTNRLSCIFRPPTHNPFMDPRTNRPSSEVKTRISLTCALLSLLSYREPLVIMRALGNGILPDCQLLSIDARWTESQAYVFANSVDRFLVLAVRGTEPELLRDWVSSLDLTMQRFLRRNHNWPGMAVRKSYLNAARSLMYAVPVKLWPDEEDKPLRTHKKPRYDEDDDDVDGVRGDQLLDYLLDCHLKGWKIYITGHSLGGGIGTLIAAILATKGCPPTAYISFGAPSVGNDKFKAWFTEHVKCAWRFVHGDEFAPMSPPFPSALTDVADKEQDEWKYHHVGELVETKQAWKGYSNEDSDDNDLMTTRRLKKLDSNDQLLKLLTDHDLMESIAVQQAWLKEFTSESGGDEAA